MCYRIHKGVTIQILQGRDWIIINKKTCDTQSPGDLVFYLGKEKTPEIMEVGENWFP